MTDAKVPTWEQISDWYRDWVRNDIDLDLNGYIARRAWDAAIDHVAHKVAGLDNTMMMPQSKCAAYIRALKGVP